MRYPTIYDILCDKGRNIAKLVSTLSRFDFTDPENPVDGALMLYLKGMRDLHNTLSLEYPEYERQAMQVGEELDTAIAIIQRLPITEGP